VTEPTVVHIDPSTDISPVKASPSAVSLSHTGKAAFAGDERHGCSDVRPGHELEVAVWLYVENHATATGGEVAHDQSRFRKRVRVLLAHHASHYAIREWSDAVEEMERVGRAPDVAAASRYEGFLMHDLGVAGEADVADVSLIPRPLRAGR
jgi:hypothetical protein